MANLLTGRQIKEAVDNIFDKYPGVRVNLSALVAYVMTGFTITPSTHSQIQSEITDWIRNEYQPGGSLSMVRGKNGGIFRSQATQVKCATGWNVSIPQPEHSTTIAAQPTFKNANDKTCLSCGNAECNSDERSCWKCGASLQ